MSTFVESTQNQPGPERNRAPVEGFRRCGPHSVLQFRASIFHTSRIRQIEKYQIQNSTRFVAYINITNRVRLLKRLILIFRGKIKSKCKKKERGN